MVSLDKAAATELMMTSKKKETKFDFNLTESSDEDIAITPLNTKKLSRERSCPERNTPSPDRKKSSSENEEKILTISDLDRASPVNDYPQFGTIKSRSSIVSMTTVDLAKRSSLEGDFPNQSPISESPQELGSTLNVLRSPNSKKRSSTFFAKQQLDLQAILDQPELETQSPTLGFIGRIKSPESVVKKKSWLSEAKLGIPSEENQVKQEDISSHMGENNLHTKIRLLFNQDTLPTISLAGDPQLAPTDNEKEMSSETGRQKFIRPRRIGRRNSQEFKNANSVDLDPSEVQRKIRTVIHIKGKDDAVFNKLEQLREKWANHLANSSRQNSGTDGQNEENNNIVKEAETGLPMLIVRKIDDISPGKNQQRESPESLNESCVFE